MQQITRRRLLGTSPVAVVAAAAFVVALFAIPPVWGNFLPQRVSDYLIFGMPALAVALIAGHARLLNVGVGATFGASAYAVAVVAQHGLVSPVPVMLISIGVGVLSSVLFAIYAVVATGLEYLLLTLLTTSAFAALPLLFSGPLGGENGLPVMGSPGISFGLVGLSGNGFYWLLCVVTVFWLGLSWYLLRSRVGRATIAVGRNPGRAAAMGYSVNAYRVAVTLYSGTIAASAGWLYAIDHIFVFQDLLGLQNSVNFVLYSLVGGVDTVVGPLLGTVGLRFLQEFTGQQGAQSQLYVGIALLVAVYLLPAGVVGAARQLWVLRHRLRRAARGEVEEPLSSALSEVEMDSAFTTAPEE